jgi:hypothetical protein
MNINPAAAASIAGTSSAAGRGGESDNQANEASRQQSASETPAGKSSESAIDAGDQTQDRGGDGRQVLDVFEKADDEEQQQEELQKEDQQEKRSNGASPEGSGEHLDLEA